MSNTAGASKVDHPPRSWRDGAALCLMTVHAHPDDEASKSAGTVARYHAEGVRTVLVTCTGGEEGDILNPALDTPEVRADLAGTRRRELARSAEIIGYDVAELLGYRDSGMAGSPSNDNPKSFWGADLDEAIGRLVALIRRERPQVMIVYPEDQRGYPHPDHIRAHEIGARAFDAAGDPDAYPGSGEPHTPQKLYYVSWSFERARLRHEKFIDLGLPSPYEERLRQAMELDAVVEPTARISLAGFEDVAQRALLAHATQVDPTSPFWFGLPEDIERSLYPYDDYVLARSHVATAACEDDLFAGLR